MSYTSRISAILTEADHKAAMVVEKTARDIEAGAKVRSRVDTGAMRNGWAAGQISDLEWEVANPVEHSIYNEFGTRHMSAQPMVVPATEQARPGFVAAIKRAYE